MNPIQSMIDPVQALDAHRRQPAGRRIIKWTKDERKELAGPVRSKIAGDYAERRLAAKRAWKQADRNRAMALGLTYDMYRVLRRSGRLPAA